MSEPAFSSTAEGRSDNAIQCRFFGLHSWHQITKFHIKCNRKFFNCLQCDVSFPSFNQADVCAMKTGQFRKFFLRNAFRDPNFSD